MAKIIMIRSEEVLIKIINDKKLYKEGSGWIEETNDE